MHVNFLSLYQLLRTHINLLKMYDKWPSILEFNITQYEAELSLILRFDKLLRVSEINTTCTNWNSKCYKNMTPIIKFVRDHLKCVPLD